jgi:nucleotide-binding universal stress UspA family protein
MTAHAYNAVTPLARPPYWTLGSDSQLLLATDGTAAASAATQVADSLGARWRVKPRQVSPEVEGGSLDPAEILRIADDQKSELIVMGLRPHAFLDRVFRDEAALAVMRHASVPVLGVTPALTRLPRSIAVAVDFSRASIAAARVAMSLVEEGGSLLLAYVEPPMDRLTGSEGFGVIYAQGVSAAFARLRQELRGSRNVSIETLVLNGRVAAELLSFAERADVDVLAVGSQRHSIAHRAFLGSVTTALARAATRSLLVVPPGYRA